MAPGGALVAAAGELDAALGDGGDCVEPCAKAGAAARAKASAGTMVLRMRVTVFPSLLTVTVKML
jgi:hypothetical protein